MLRLRCLSRFQSRCRAPFSPSACFSNQAPTKDANPSSQTSSSSSHTPHASSNMPTWTETFDQKTNSTTFSASPPHSASSSPSSSSKPSTTPPHLAQLLRWLEGQGGFGEFCVVSNDVGYEKGRGMFAIQPLSPGGERPVISVPASLAISISNIEQRSVKDALFWSDIIPQFEVTENPNFDAAGALAMFLLHEKSKHKKSFYYQWIRYFPDEVRNGLYFGERELEELKGCSEVLDLIYTKVAAFLKLDKVRASLCQRHPEVFDPRIYTTDEFKWAFSTILARSITDDALPTVVPYIDFMNVATELINTNSDLLLSEAGDKYEVRVNKEVPPGTELTTNYCSSEAGGAEMLCRYGFISSAMNANMSVRFRFRVPRPLLSKLERNMRLWDQSRDEEIYGRTEGTAEPERMLDEKLLAEQGNDGDDEMPYIDLKDGRVEIPIDFFTVPAPMPAWVLEVLRALVIEKHKLAQYSPLETLPYEYEIGVYEKLINILESRMDNYLTNVAEDLALLKAEDAKPKDVPHLRSFGSEIEDTLSVLEKKAREQNNMPPKDDDDVDPEMAEFEKELLSKTKSNPQQIEHRLYIHIVRLRLQEKLVLQHHLTETQKQLSNLEDQYERRMRILRRARSPQQ